MEKESQYTIASVKKALKVLKLFDSQHKNMTLTEISDRADTRKGTMIRVLTTLEEEGFIRYDEISKRYSLGMAVYVLSNTAFQFLGIVETARPLLEKVTMELNLVTHLAILEGDKIVLVDRVVPNADALVYDLNSRIGGEVEAHNTGVGKVLTAFAPDDLKERIIRRCSFKRYSERTITDEAVYRELLTKIRRDGYATNEGESEPYLKCITYPIFGYDNKIIGALSLTGMLQCIDDTLEERCHTALKEITGRISEAMGYGL